MQNFFTESSNTIFFVLQFGEKIIWFFFETGRFTLKSISDSDFMNSLLFLFTGYFNFRGKFSYFYGFAIWYNLRTFCSINTSAIDW